ELHVYAWYLAQLQRQTELDATACHALRDQRARIGLERGKPLRDAQLEIEVPVIQGADRDGDGGTFVLARHTREPGHGFDHEIADFRVQISDFQEFQTADFREPPDRTQSRGLCVPRRRRFNLTRLRRLDFRIDRICNLQSI